MGYCTDKPRRVIFNGNLALSPRGIVVWGDDNEELLRRSADEMDADSDDAAVLPDGSAFFVGEVTTRRADGDNIEPLELAILFAEHSFVKAARSTLSDALTVRGVLDVEWCDPSEWRMVLERVDQWTPAQVSRLIRSSDWSEARKVDMQSIGFACRDGDFYLLVRSGASLAALRTAFALESQAAGMILTTQFVQGIYLGRTDAPIEDDLGDIEADYPLVATDVSLFGLGRTLHTWSLRGLSQDQTKELQNWEHVVKRKGRDASFTTRALPPLVSAYIRLAFEQEDEATDAIFAAALSMLRAYSNTRADFVREVTAIIVQARGDEGSRRQFSGAMRSTLRRYGLTAYQDGLTDGGLNVDGLSLDDVTIVRAWLAQQVDYVTGFGAELFKEGGIRDEDVPVRAAMWAQKSLDDLYYAALRSAAPLKPATWRRDPAKDSCSDCVERDGMTLTLDEWGQLGFPRDSRLSCGGFHCGCQIMDEQGKVLRSR
jgi:hypothetical protein